MLTARFVFASSFVCSCVPRLKLQLVWFPKNPESAQDVKPSLSRMAAPGLPCWAGAAHCSFHRRSKVLLVTQSKHAVLLLRVQRYSTQLQLPLRVLKSSMTPEDHASDQLMGSLLLFQRQVQTCGIKRLINVQCAECLRLYLVHSRGALLLLPSGMF